MLKGLMVVDDFKGFQITNYVLIVASEVLKIQTT